MKRINFVCGLVLFFATNLAVANLKNVGPEVWVIAQVKVDFGVSLSHSAFEIPDPSEDINIYPHYFPYDTDHFFFNVEMIEGTSADIVIGAGQKNSCWLRYSVDNNLHAAIVATNQSDSSIQCIIKGDPNLNTAVIEISNNSSFRDYR